MAGLEKLCGGWPATVKRQAREDWSRSTNPLFKNYLKMDVELDIANNIEYLRVEVKALDKARQCVAYEIKKKYSFMAFLPVTFQSPLPTKDDGILGSYSFNTHSTFFDDLFLTSAAQAVGGEFLQDVKYYQGWQRVVANAHVHERNTSLNFGFMEGLANR